MLLRGHRSVVTSGRAMEFEYSNAVIVLVGNSSMSFTRPLFLIIYLRELLYTVPCYFHSPPEFSFLNWCP